MRRADGYSQPAKHQDTPEIGQRIMGVKEMQTIIDILYFLAICEGLLGVLLSWEHPIIGTGLMLAAFVAVMWLRSRWDYEKGERDG